MKKTSLLNNTSLWLGAAISVAEIMSGSLIASIGLKKGLIAIIIGHIIGGILFFLYGKIGAESGCSSMRCASFSFGEQGAQIFAVMNVTQLTAWSAIMLHISAQLLTTLSRGFLPLWAWCMIIGAGVLLWLFFSNTQIGSMNLITSALLLCLTFYMCYHSVKRGVDMAEATDFVKLSFGSAIEVAAAMPISWLPLVADYTSTAEKPRVTNAMSTLIYILGSIWMFCIGLGAALACGHMDIVQLILRLDFLRVPLIIVFLATMTTTFIEACSAGISAQTIFEKYSVRMLSMLLMLVAIAAAIFMELAKYDSFLFVLSSVFVPMSVIVITDYFMLGGKNTKNEFDMGAMLLWAVGFIMYHLFVSLGLPCGCTLPVAAVLCAVRYITERPRRLK